jgi:hypothetical protein
MQTTVGVVRHHPETERIVEALRDIEVAAGLIGRDRAGHGEPAAPAAWPYLDQLVPRRHPGWRGVNERG